MNPHDPDDGAVLKAQGEVVMAALEVVQCIMAEPGAHHGDALQYAEEQLTLAARDLVRETDKLPADARPVGWGEWNPPY